MNVQFPEFGEQITLQCHDAILSGKFTELHSNARRTSIVVEDPEGRFDRINVPDKAKQKLTVLTPNNLTGFELYKNRADPRQLIPVGTYEIHLAFEVPENGELDHVTHMFNPFSVGLIILDRGNSSKNTEGSEPIQMNFITAFTSAKAYKPCDYLRRALNETMTKFHGPSLLSCTSSDHELMAQTSECDPELLEEAAIFSQNHRKTGYFVGGNEDYAIQASILAKALLPAKAVGVSIDKNIL